MNLDKSLIRKRLSLALGRALFLVCVCNSLLANAQTPRPRVMPSDSPKSDEFAYTMEMLGAVLGLTNTYFVDTVSLRAIHSDALNYMLQSLDPYTVYMPKKEATEFRESTSGQYGGIGAILRQRADRVMIDSPMQGKPADKAGLRSGDVILKVNDKDFTRAQVVDVRNTLRGAPGEKLTITVQRAGLRRPLTVTLNREIVDMNPIAYSDVLEGDVGYLRLNTFTTTSHVEMAEAIRKMRQTAPLKGLVIDLRDNGGGVLQSAVEIVGMFVPQGSEVVSLKSRVAQQNYAYRTSQTPIDLTMPIVVLINGASASASEIVAGALQDYDRAVVMGQKSYGKGLVQSTLPLPDSAILKLTTAHYYIPSGRNIQRLKYNHQGGAEDLLKKSSDSTLYYTKGGRPVWGAGGITPDVTTIPDSIPRILTSLLVDTLTFDYISQFVREHPQQPDLRTFSISQSDYEAFVKKILDSRFELYSPSSALIEQLEKVFREEKRDATATPHLESLKKALGSTTEKILRDMKSDIVEYLNMNIIERYYYSEGGLRYYIPKDSTVRQAIALIKDPDRYRKTLAVEK